MNRCFSVVIPYFNGIKFLEDAIRIPVLDDRVDEILIIDDHSTRRDSNALLQKLREFRAGAKISFDSNFNEIVNSKPRCLPGILATTMIEIRNQITKVKVIRNKINLVDFRNKLRGVESAKNDWVYLLDCDNYLVESTIPSLYHIKIWNQEICYCPSVSIMDRFEEGNRPWDDWNARRFGYSAMNILDVRRYLEIDRNLHSKYGCGIGVLGFLNTGNFFVNRNMYLEVIDKVNFQTFNPHAADALAFTYLWLKSGKKLQVVSDLYYRHRIRPDSLWTKNAKVSHDFQNYIENLLLNA
jgi:hypothetical protein